MFDAEVNARFDAERQRIRTLEAKAAAFDALLEAAKPLAEQFAYEVEGIGPSVYEFEGEEPRWSVMIPESVVYGLIAAIESAEKAAGGEEESS